jgi:multiple sugar transport system substrate-binding protein
MPARSCPGAQWRKEMAKLSRRSVLRGSSALVAAAALARPHIANAAATTATVWFAQGFIPSEDVALRKLVADYEKQSGNTIDLSIIPFVALRQKEVAAVTSGVVPEVMEDADFSFTPLNAWKDNLLDVTDIIESQKAQFSPVVLLGRHLYNNVQKTHSYYGVPMKVASTTLHIWQSLVTKAGYKVSDIPNTWDAFIDFFLPMQAKLRAQGMRHLYAWGTEVSTNGVDPVATFTAHLVANGGKDLVTPDGKLHDDDPQIREAVIKTLTRLTDLFKAGYVPPGVVNWNDQDNNNSFHAKEIILCFNGSMSIELAQIDEKEVYEDQLTHAIPNGNDGKPLPAQIGEFGLVIPKKAQNVALAKEFIKYSIEPKVLNEYLKGGLGRWAIPYPETIKSDPFWLHSGDPHRLTYITQTMVTPTFPLYEAYNPAAAEVDSEHVFQQGWNDIINGGMTPAAAADKALKRVKEIFAKYPIPQA